MDYTAHNIIKQLTLQDGRSSIHLLLPIKEVYKGYGGNGSYLWEPHLDYFDYWDTYHNHQIIRPPKRKVYKWNEIKDDKVRASQMEVVNQSINEYNKWAKLRNDTYFVDRISSLIYNEDDEHKPKELDIESLSDLNKNHNALMNPIPIWAFTVQLYSPNYRKLEDFEFLSLATIENQMLYWVKEKVIKGEEFCLGERLYIGTGNGEDFCIALNIFLFDHIRKMVKIAKDNEAWDENNEYWYPNKEFVHYFQAKGIVPDEFEHKIDFSEDPDEEPYATIEELFDPQDFKAPSYSLLKIALMAQEVFEEKKHKFIGHGGKPVKREAFREACKKWTLNGKKIHWKQLEKQLHK